MKSLNLFMIVTWLVSFARVHPSQTHQNKPESLGQTSCVAQLIACLDRCKSENTTTITQPITTTQLSKPAPRIKFSEMTPNPDEDLL